MDKKEYKFDIISFSGRKESGKTELANICVDGGYEKKSFATALKQLVCNITGIRTINELNEYKNKPIGVCVNKHELEILEENTGFECEYLKKATEKITELSTARDWLQIIGTDVIRACDPDWHVRKTLETLEPNKKYVFDDTRFPNELKALKEMGAECWFIIRTKTDNISNHYSETALNYRDFDYHIIVNNISLDELKKRWKFYFECHDVTAPMREWGIAQLFMNHYVPLAYNTLNKFFVYREFTSFKKKIAIPEKVTQNSEKTGFVGDDGNPFITEEFKKYYNNEA